MSMSHMARLLRPKRFADVVGQEMAIDLIRNALDQNMMLPVCTIFGPSGVGKTTLARLIALAQCCTNKIAGEPCGECSNCTAILNDSHPDIFELDGGTYTSVEDIKTMLEGINYCTTSFNINNKKIYILDEVHMLSRHAMTALLKKFEEPMHNLQFILATTNVDKLPETILSRSFQIRLEPVSHELVTKYLTNISKENEYNADPNALLHIAKAGHGSIRQSLSLLEQASILCSGRITENKVETMLGLASNELVSQIMMIFESGDVNRMLDLLGNSRNIDAETLLKQILGRFQNDMQEKKLSDYMIKIAYDLAEASIVMHKSPHSEHLVEICFGYVMIKNAQPKPKLSELARKIF